MASPHTELWRTSSASANVNCVEVALTDPVRVRDSHDRSGPHLELPPSCWSAFVDAVRDGQFRPPD